VKNAVAMGRGGGQEKGGRGRLGFPLTMEREYLVASLEKGKKKGRGGGLGTSLETRAKVKTLKATCTKNKGGRQMGGESGRKVGRATNSREMW